MQETTDTLSRYRPGVRFGRPPTVLVMLDSANVDARRHGSAVAEALRRELAAQVVVLADAGAAAPLGCDLVDIRALQGPPGTIRRALPPRPEPPAPAGSGEPCTAHDVGARLAAAAELAARSASYRLGWHPTCTGTSAPAAGRPLATPAVGGPAAPLLRELLAPRLECLLELAGASHLLQALAPDLVLLAVGEPSRTATAIAQRASAAGIAVLLVPPAVHAAEALAALAAEVRAAAVALDSEAALERWRRCDTSRAVLHVIDDMAGAALARGLADRERRRAALAARLAIPAGLPLVVCSLDCGAVAGAGGARPELAARAMARLAVLRSVACATVLLRASAEAASLRRHETASLRFTSLPLVDLVPLADVVVTDGGPPSRWAARCGIPVVELAADACSADPTGGPALEGCGIVLARDAAAVGDALRRMLADPSFVARLRAVRDEARPGSVDVGWAARLARLAGEVAAAPVPRPAGPAAEGAAARLLARLRTIARPRPEPVGRSF